MIRTMKVILAAFVGFFCLMYALQNIMNLQPAHDFVAAMVGMEGHAVYPGHLGPSVHSPALVWLMLWIIIVLELVAGALAAKGAIDLWRARKAGEEQFTAAKRYAVLGAGLAVIIWFGIFSAIGGAYFQMWQTDAGGGALEGAFWYSVQNGLVLLIILAPEP